MSDTINRQVLLVEKPTGKLGPEHFKMSKAAIPEPKDGEYLSRTIWMSLDPYMRGRMAETKGYAANVGLGDAMVGGTVGQVVKSKNAKFKFGVAPLPYYGAPQNTIIGGASLWVMSGKSKETYRGVAKFFTHLSSPEVRAEWHQGTGYLPITNAAYDLTKSSGFYDKNPALTVRTSGRNRPAPDAKLGVTFPADKLHRFDRASGQRIGPAPSAANADRSADVRSHE